VYKYYGVVCGIYVQVICMATITKKVLYDKGNDRLFVILPKGCGIPVGSLVKIEPLWLSDNKE
jgi:hypothetical protein